MSAQRLLAPLGSGWRLLAGALLVVAVAVRLAPGTLSEDGSLGLVLDPGRFLRVALGGWSQAGAGYADDASARQVPFAALYGLGDVAGLAPWLTQTILRTAVLLLAYAGGVLLSRSLLGRHRLEVAAGLFVALNPVLLGRAVSSLPDALALAAAPLVIAPLLGSGRGPSARRVALAAAVPTALLGPAEVMWSGAVLLVGLFATATGPGPRARRTAWWLLFTAMASGWWLWVVAWGQAHAAEPPVAEAGGLSGALRSVLRLGSSAGLPALLLGAVLTFAIAWCWHSSTRRLAPLATLLLVAGTAAAVAEHLVGPLRVGAVPAPPGSSLVPATATEVLLGLTWALGAAGVLVALSHLALSRTAPAGMTAPSWLRAVGATGCALLVLSAVFLTRTPSDETVDGGRLPAEWTAFGGWLEEQPPGAVLVLPPTPRGSARWGTTSAEPLSALTDRQWWSRSDRPQTASDATRMLDAATSRLVRGRGSAGVAEILRRLGVRFVVLRRDLRSAASAEVAPRLLRHGLATTPGWTVATSFGASGSPDLLGRSIGFGLADQGPLLEVWATGAGQPVRAYPASATMVAGGPEAVLALADGGAPGRATLPWSHAGVVTDQTRRRSVQPAAVIDPGGATQRRGESATPDPTARRPAAAAVARFSGVTRVAASSAVSEPSSRGPRRLDSAPFAAVDGNPFTAWRSAPGDVGGAWWVTTFVRPTSLADASVIFVDSRLLGPRVNVVRVQTEHESAVREVLPGGEVFLDLARPATELRITVTGLAAAAGAADAVGIAQVLVPGLTAERTLVLPAGGAGASWVLGPDPATVGQCLVDDGATLCSPGLSLAGEDSGRLDRVVRTPLPRSLPVQVTVRALPGAALRNILDARVPTRTRATASSTFVPDPMVRPRAAVDADPQTSWLAAVDDEKPVLRLRWEEPRSITGLTLVHAATPLSSTPLRVALRTPDQEVEVRLDGEGKATFPTMVTDRVDIEVLETTRDVTIDPRTAGLIELPVGIAEAQVSGAPAATAVDARQEIALPCGQGPRLEVGGRTVDSSVRATVGDLLALNELDAAPCQGRVVRLAEGEDRIRFVPSLLWSPVRVVLGELPAPAAARRVSGGTRGPAEVSARLGAGSSAVVASSLAAAPGWTAELDGRRLQRTVVDGWGAAWLVPAGPEGTMRVSFAAGAWLRQGMVLGAGAALVPLIWLGIATARDGRRRRTRTSRTDTATSGVDGVSRREREMLGNSTR